MTAIDPLPTFAETLFRYQLPRSTDFLGGRGCIVGPAGSRSRTISMSLLSELQRRQTDDTDTSDAGLPEFERKAITLSDSEIFVAILLAGSQCWRQSPDADFVILAVFRISVDL